MQTSSLPFERVRRIVRLMGETRELGIGTEAARVHFISGTIALLGAALGAIVRDPGYALGLKRRSIQSTLVGFDRGTFPVCAIQETEGCEFNPYEAAVMRHVLREPREVHTASNHQMVPKRVWSRSQWVNEYVRPARLDHYLGSTLMVGPNCAEGVGFMRAAGDRAFREEDRLALHLLRLETPQLFAPFHRRIPLAPRVQATLECMLTGAADKEIADKMNISHHTVRQYVKTIFKAYGVTSRGQLIARSANGLTLTTEHIIS